MAKRGQRGSAKGTADTDRFVVADGHSDIVVDILRRRQRGERAVFQRLHATQLSDAGVRMLMLATGGDGPTQNVGKGDPFWCTMMRIQALLEDFEESAASARICKSMAEVDETLAEGRLAGMLMIEGAAPLGGSLESLDLYHRLGIRSVQLTWNARNLVGDGCAESATGGGLTAFGRAVVGEMNRRRLLVDLSHASEATFYAAAESATAPFIVSHANARAVCDHRRNLTDQQLKLLAERGGVIGLCFFPWFIDPVRPSLERLLDHFDHIAGLIGPRHVSIGADYIYYAPEVFAIELSASDRAGIYAKGFDVPSDLRDPTGFRQLADGMSARGYSDDDIAGVMSGNLLRVYRETIG
ncbi:MAG: membrane dipeptidase [Hyphomicrobiaceae bacterium]